ncbi:MAG: hypothetical protein Q4A54_00215 [Parabacteroides sp.]|nr:hypothetical protein [Parabacteroides sp.]
MITLKQTLTWFSFLCISIFFFSCIKAEDLTKEQELYYTVKQISAINPDGFIVSDEDGKTMPTGGYAFNHSETQDCFDDEGLRKVLNFCVPNVDVNYIGGKKMTEKNCFQYTAISIYDTLEKAAEKAKAYGQTTIYCLQTRTKYHWDEASGSFLPESQQ